MGQTRLGLDSWRFSSFFFFDRLFASLLVLRSAHDGLGVSLFYLLPYPFCIGSIVSFVTASSRLLARSREEPPNICGSFGLAGHTGKLHSTETLPP